MAEPEKVPFTVSSDAIVKVINTGMETGGNAIWNQFHQHKAALDRSTTPSEIAAELQATDQKGRELAGFYVELAKRIEAESNQIIAAKERETSTALAPWTAKKKDLDDKQGLQAAKVAIGGTQAAPIFLGMLADALTGGLSGGAFTMMAFGASAAGTAAAAHGAVSYSELEEQLKPVNREIERLNALLEEVKQNKPKDLKVIANKEAVMTLAPKIMAYKAAHGKELAAELARIATNYGTTPDKIAEYLGTQANLRGNLAALLRADYVLDDVAAVANYAQTAKITDSREQRAFLQFVNHSIVPHQDFFEIWASKCHDLRTVASDIQKAYEANNAAARPALELFREKPLSIAHPTGSNLTAPERVQHAEGETVLAKAMEATSGLQYIHTVLADKDKPIKERHEAVKKEAVDQLGKFNKFFGTIGTRITEVENQLNRVVPTRDRLEMRWDRARANAMQLEMLKIRDPGKRHSHNTLVDMASVGGGLVLDVALAPFGAPPVATAAALSRIGSNEIRIFGTRIREDMEHAVLKASIEDRNRIEPTEMAKLKKDLLALDEEIKKLADNKDFLDFLGKDPRLETIREMYMLLPRLIAGESNVDALEFRTQKSGYNSIDHFVTDLRRENPRLADAMENFLLGFANTNDLRVIVAEANAIKEPASPKEKVLVDYVEKVIKKHYIDQSRQSSIVDYLEMRNVILTSRPFHSFGEIVKKETDVALRALLGGTGDFSLVGSNDVHEIFADCQARHGEDFFADPHSPHDSGQMAHKRVHVVTDPDEIEAKHKQVIQTRQADTRIPRVKSIFTEICAYEYLLTQGVNIVKDKRLASTPQALGALSMVDSVTRSFIDKLAIEAARKKRQGGDPKKQPDLGKQVENLIALSFVEFFSELGARHSADNLVQDRLQKVRNAYTGENYSLATTSYTDVVTENAQESFGVFLEIYRNNLEKYLERATRENRKVLLEQLAEVKDLMKDIQPEGIVLPDSEEARLKAHHRNHSLSNMGANPSTWAARAAGISRGTAKEV